MEANGKKFKISSNPHNITQLENYLQKISAQYNICQDKFPNILISLTEAVNNAIIHGNNKDENKSVAIECENSPTGISFTVHDEGSGFDLNNVPDPTAYDRIECCGGRGVYIMTSLCDKIRYKNNGSSVEMFFQL